MRESAVGIGTTESVVLWQNWLVPLPPVGVVAKLLVPLPPVCVVTKLVGITASCLCVLQCIDVIRISDNDDP